MFKLTMIRIPQFLLFFRLKNIYYFISSIVRDCSVYVNKQVKKTISLPLDNTNSLLPNLGRKQYFVHIIFKSKIRYTKMSV
jgi:hypothetical protein